MLQSSAPHWGVPHAQTCPSQHRSPVSHAPLWSVVTSPPPAAPGPLPAPPSFAPGTRPHSSLCLRNRQHKTFRPNTQSPSGWAAEAQGPHQFCCGLGLLWEIKIMGICVVAVVTLCFVSMLYLSLVEYQIVRSIHKKNPVGFNMKKRRRKKEL